MKILLNLMLVMLTFFQFFIYFDSNSATAQSKSKSLNKEELKQLEETVDKLTKKIYAYSLFTPEESAQLVDIKTKLNPALTTNTKDSVYARLFYDTAFICKEREYFNDAIQYFQAVVQKFPDTAYAKTALIELKALGVKIEGEADEADE